LRPCADRAPMTKRRFEFDNGASKKFWEIAVLREAVTATKSASDPKHCSLPMQVGELAFG
jgi:hypothetical protein